MSLGLRRRSNLAHGREPLKRYSPRNPCVALTLGTVAPSAHCARPPRRRRPPRSLATQIAMANEGSESLLLEILAQRLHDGHGPMSATRAADGHGDVRLSLAAVEGEQELEQVAEARHEVARLGLREHVV